MDFTPSARIICDSVAPFGDRLTTMVVTLHRYMLPEFNTHRAFSRNSASSRAIPVRKTLATVADTPAVPTRWRSERKGMQGGPEIAEPGKARDIWLAARDDAVNRVEQLLQLGVHKSIVNRLLEPFLPHTVIVSATNWTGFWEQRCNPDAQDDIRVAAEAMAEAYENSTPTYVKAKEWHLPFLNDYEREHLNGWEQRAVSTARCARVSYLTHDGRRDLAADIELFQRLVTANPPHASPLEHVAVPAAGFERTTEALWPSNYTGWIQLRHLSFGR